MPKDNHVVAALIADVLREESENVKRASAALADSELELSVMLVYWASTIENIAKKIMDRSLGVSAT